MFLGCQTYFDVGLILRKLIKVIKDKFKGFELIYRPHPWRENFKKTFVPKGVIIDPTLSNNADRYGDLLLPNLNLYNHIISNAHIVIGGCTSMIVEVSLMKKPYLLLAHDDGNPIQNPFDYYISSENQNLTAIINNLSVCYSLENLYYEINSLMKKDLKDDDPVLDYIIDPKYSKFSFYLNKLIEEKFL